MSMDLKKTNLEVAVGVMQGSIDGIQATLTEIKKSITDLRIEITTRYVTNDQLQLEIKRLVEGRELELKNLRDSFEPTKKTVDDLVGQILRWVLMAGLGAFVALLATGKLVI